MYISDREKSQFTELYLRTCRSRDSLYILPGLTVLEGLGCKQLLVREIWTLCDRRKAGRLSFGEFLCACHLSRHVKFRHELNGGFPEQLERYLDLKPPIPVYWAEDQERAELVAAGGMFSPIALEAFASIDDTFPLLREAVARVLCLLSHNRVHHEAVKLKCPSLAVVTLLREPLSASARKCAAQALSSLSSSGPSWVGECLVHLLVVITQDEEDKEIRRIVMNTLANCMTDLSMCERLLAQRIYSRKGLFDKLSFVCMENLTPAMLFEVLRFYHGIHRSKGVCDLLDVYRDFLRELLRVPDSTFPLFNEECSIEFFSLVRDLICTSELRSMLLYDIGLVALLHKHMPQRQLGSGLSGPHLGLLLSAIVAHPDSREIFQEQGGIDLILDLCSICTSDEIVRLNCVLITSSLLESDRVRLALTPAETERLLVMLQDSCEQSSHLEIMSKAFDAWLLLAERSGAWGSATVTAASFLLSDSLELKIKALSVLAFLLKYPDQRQLIIGVSAACPTGNERFLVLLLDCIPRCVTAGALEYNPALDLSRVDPTMAEDCVLSLLRSLYYLVSDDDHAIIQLLETRRVSNNVYELYFGVSGEPRSAALACLGKLFCREERIQRRLLSELTSASKPSGLDLVIAAMRSVDDCVTGVAALVKDSRFVLAVAQHAPEVLATVESLLVRDSASTSTQGVAEILRYLCMHAEKSRVATHLVKLDLISLLVRLLHDASRMQSSIESILALLQSDRKRWLPDLMQPSRLFAIASILRRGGNRNHLLDIFHTACDVSSTHTQLVVDSLGVDMHLLVEAATVSCRTQDLTLISSVMQINRVRRMVCRQSAFVELSTAATRGKGLDELLNIVSREKFADIDKLRRLVEIVNILADLTDELIINGSHGISESSVAHIIVTIPRTAFLHVDLTALSRKKVPPPDVRSPQHRVLYALLSLIEASLKLNRSQTSPLGIGLSQFRSKLQRFAQARETHRSLYGETSFSMRVAEFVGTCEHAADRT